MNKNVILATLGSLRFNYPGCCGHTWIKTPNLNRLAAKACSSKATTSKACPRSPVGVPCIAAGISSFPKGGSPWNCKTTTCSGWSPPMASPWAMASPWDIADLAAAAFVKECHEQKSR